MDMPANSSYPGRWRCALTGHLSVGLSQPSPKQYAFDDFTISQVAKTLGNNADAAKGCILLALASLSRVIILEQYAARAGYFMNNWSPNVTVPDGPPGLMGMMQVCRHIGLLLCACSWFLTGARDSRE